MSKKKTKFIECECASEGLLITHWPHDTMDRSIYLTMYSAGTYSNDALSFRERLRHAWNIMKTGHPFTDSLILNESTAKELGEYLIDVKFEEDENDGK